MATDVRLLFDSIDQMQDEWNKIQIGKSGTASVRGLWQEGKRMHDHVSKNRKAVEEQLSNVLRNPDYSPEFKNKQRNKCVEEFEKSTEGIREGYRSDVRSYARDVRQMIDKMLISVPSKEQRELLDVLKMRGKNISEEELYRILPVFFTNANALRAFEQIARDSGYRLLIPMADTAELYRTVDELEHYFLLVANEIGKQKPDLRYRAFFWTDPEGDHITADNNITRFSNTLDTVPQLQDLTKSQLTAAEKSRLRNMFYEVTRLDPEVIADTLKIADLTKEILEKNPDDIPLILQSEYAPYARICLEVEKAKMQTSDIKMASDGKADSITNSNGTAPENVDE